jgi:ribosomal protein L12E/L44/L45/RPP1/RPP2
MSNAQRDELACVYAALLLFDDGLDVTADKIKAVTDAAGIAVEPFYPTLFANYLAKKNLGDLLNSVGSAPAAAAPAAGAAAPAGGAAKKEEKKPVEEEEEEGDMGFGLFG